MPDEDDSARGPDSWWKGWQAVYGQAECCPVCGCANGVRTFRTEKIKPVSIVVSVLLRREVRPP